jgi:hypothetical protein
MFKGDSIMELVTVEGVYRNGQIELSERPDGMDQARVMVTFLPETSGLQPEVKPSSVESTSQNAMPTIPRYSQELRQEYKRLIQSKLRGALTPEEAGHLANVRAEINHLDRQSASWATWEAQSTEIDRELADLRRILEAMPDA